MKRRLSTLWKELLSNCIVAETKELFSIPADEELGAVSTSLTNDTTILVLAFWCKWEQSQKRSGLIYCNFKGEKGSKYLHNLTNQYFCIVATR